MLVDFDLSCIDVVEFLGALDIQNITDDGLEARYSCPYPAHGAGDRHPSAYMNMETTAFICFSCGAVGNAVTLLAEVKQVPRLTAKNWLAQKWSPYSAQIDSYRDFIERRFNASEAAVEDPVPQVIPEEALDSGPVYRVDWGNVDTPWADYMRSRLAAETMDAFGFAYDSIADRPCITVRSPDGGLIGFKGRAWRPDQNIKYLVAGDTPRALAEYGPRYGFSPYDASRHVFAANIAVPQDGHLIVREGEINVASMHEKGFRNVVGPSGSTLSDAQVRQIVSMCDKVTIFLDTDRQNEASYATSHFKIYKALKAFEPYVDVMVVGDHDGDPAVMDAATIQDLLDRATTGTRYQLDRILSHKS